MRAKIYSPARNPMQSGQAKTGHWVLEFQQSSSKSVDPLMGWSGSKGTSGQIRMSFESKDAAIQYAQAQNLNYDIIEIEARKRKFNIRKQGYAENFSTNRRQPWTH